MSTLRELVDQVELQLHGYAADQPSQTHLTADIDADDLTLAVDDHRKVSSGLVQVEDELVYVTGSTASGLTLAPYGRGYASSTAASHGVGARVMDKPLFPRAQIKRALNEVVTNLYPELYALGTETFTFTAAQSTYPLPSDVVGVNAVHLETIGPSKHWHPAKRWAFNARANTATFPTGKSLDLWSVPVPGRTVQVDVKKLPSPLTGDADEFSTVTGLPAYAEQAVTLGVCYQMVGWADASRLQTRAVESSQRSAYVETGAAAELSKYFYALYTAELQRAALRLQAETPSQMHFTRY